MATDREHPRSSTRRTATQAPKIPTGPRLGPLVPYVIAVLAAAVLIYVLVKEPAHAEIAALALGLGVMGLLGWFAAGHRLGLAPDDGLRRLLPALSVIAIAAAAVPYAYTLRPPPPQAEALLRAEGESVTMSVRGPANAVWLTVRGRIAPNASGEANYLLAVSREGGATERVEGTLHPHPGGAPPQRHMLEAHGAGRYTVRLEAAGIATAMPLRVSLSAKPFSTTLLALVYGAIAAVVIAADVLLRKRGLEPTFAAALCLPLATVLYFQRRPAAPETLATDLLAAAIVGALAGGMGAELVSRALRAVFGR